MNKKFEWENLSKDGIERHFNPRVAVPDAQRYIDNYTSKSLEAQKQIEGIYDIRYGPNPKQTLDLHIPKSLENSPLLIFSMEAIGVLSIKKLSLLWHLHFFKRELLLQTSTMIFALKSNWTN